MFSERPPSDLPATRGEEAAVTFMKNGHEYRILRFDADTWLIHSSGRSAEQFQLIVKPYGELWTLEGTNGIVFVNAMGVTIGEIFGDKFF